MKGKMNPDERGSSRYIVYLAIVVIGLIVVAWLHTEGRLTLTEDYRLSILIFGAVCAFLLSLWKSLRKSPEPKKTPEITLPTETKWREDIGSKIKKTKEIAAVIIFLVAFVFMEYNAFYVALAAYAVMRFVQYLLLEPQRKILEEVLAVAMIAGFIIIMILWAMTDFFFPVAAALFLLIFLILFLWLFWGRGFDRLWYKKR